MTLLAPHRLAQAAGPIRRSRGIRLALRLVLLALRAVVLVLALHVSGAAHAIEDVAGSCPAQVERPTDCPCDPGECPPGCPNCHGHGIAALPRPCEDLSAVVAFESTQPTFSPVDHCGPSSPELAGPFRPPQSG